MKSEQVSLTSLAPTQRTFKRVFTSMLQHIFTYIQIDGFRLLRRTHTGIDVTCISQSKLWVSVEYKYKIWWFAPKIPPNIWTTAVRLLGWLGHFRDSSNQASQTAIEISSKNRACSYAYSVNHTVTFHNQGGYYNSLIHYKHWIYLRERAAQLVTKTRCK